MRPLSFSQRGQESELPAHVVPARDVRVLPPVRRGPALAPWLELQTLRLAPQVSFRQPSFIPSP